MKVEYFEDADTLQITFTDHVVAETYDLDENTPLETDEEGRLVTMTIEHAGDQIVSPRSHRLLLGDS